MMDVIDRGVDMYIFDATDIKSCEEDDVLIVALCDDAVDPQAFIIITRLDEEDNATVEEGVGLQTAETAYEVTNAIQSVSVSENRLEVEIKPGHWQHFNGKAVVVELKGKAADDKSISLLKDSLKKLLEGSSILVDL